MVQSVNIKALSTLVSVVRRPYLAAPHVFVPTVSGKWPVHFILSYVIFFAHMMCSTLLNTSDISYQALKDHCGIKAVIFDKDNTLTAPYANVLHPRAKFGLQSALGK